MKKILHSVLTLTLGLVLSGSGCNQDAFFTQDDYYGTWKCTTGAEWEKVTFTVNKAIFENSEAGGASLTVENLTWTPVTNSSGDYMSTNPNGYKISGTVTANVNYEGPSVGGTNVCHYYISTNKGSLRIGYHSDPYYAWQSPWVKQ